MKSLVTLEDVGEALARGAAAAGKRASAPVTAFLVELALGSTLEEALDAARTACRRDSKWYGARVVSAIVLCRLKRNDEACAALSEAKRIRPRLSLSQIERLHGRRAAAELRPLWETLSANDVE